MGSRIAEREKKRRESKKSSMRMRGIETGKRRERGKEIGKNASRVCVRERERERDVMYEKDRRERK